MIRYFVKKSFTDYGMFRGVGEIISDASFIENLQSKIFDETVVPFESDQPFTLEVEDEDAQMTVITPVIKPVATPMLKPIITPVITSGKVIPKAQKVYVANPTITPAV